MTCNCFSTFGCSRVGTDVLTVTLMGLSLVTSQNRTANDQSLTGAWRDTKYVTGGRPGNLFGTSVACFILAIPNRYLPILQEGKIESLKKGL